MPYDVTDPRAQLATASPTASAPGVPRPAQYRELLDTPPDEHHPAGSATRWIRSQAVIVGHTEAREGEQFGRGGEQSGEYVVLTLDGVGLRIGHASGSVDVVEPSLVVVPGGESSITVTAPGTFVRLFAAATAHDLAELCANAGEYATDDENVAEFVAWPGSPDGDRVRAYPLAAYPIEEGRLGRIFRCSTLMVNVFGEGEPARDATKLSPHHHEDFEQISLQVDGDYVHHMRAPWTPDSSTWRSDEHRRCVAPAIVVIPPKLIHTSQAIGDMTHWLIDVFCPPRFDFSERPGWVLNAEQYPMPQPVG